MQLSLFATVEQRVVPPFRSQLLKWVGNKQRFAHEIVGYFPETFGVYYEPFLGSGAVLGTLAPNRALAGDCFQPLMEIWQAVKEAPETIKQWYAVRYRQMMAGEKVAEYERIKAAYNSNPNGADLLFLCRSCYGGVVRFRQSDGYMSTPCGPHKPIAPDSFARRVDEWHLRTAATEFAHTDYVPMLRMAQAGDFVYCDPPYSHSQSILYGAQSFQLEELLEEIARCKSRSVFVALSIDGTKRTGSFVCNLPVPQGLFEREAHVNCGRSMLRRFQMGGHTLENEVVSDRLLLTY